LEEEYDQRGDRERDRQGKPKDPVTTSSALSGFFEQSLRCRGSVGLLYRSTG